MTVAAQLDSWGRALGGEASGNSVMAPGPGHSPHDRSLSVTLDANAPGGFLVHSFAGDDPIACKDHVRARLGLPAFQPQAKMRKRERAQQPKKTYFDYHAESGAVVYQVERTDYYDGRKKTFRQRRPDGNGGWLWNLGVVQPVPYRLPELIEAAGNGNLIVIAEGERKVDLLRSWNIPATCNSGGMQKWRAEHSAYLSGADVVILPDNDQAGRLHLDAVAVSLSEVGASVRVLDLPGLLQKGDVIDWAAGGGTAEQLHALIENIARPWAPTERESVNAELAADRGAETKAAKAETFLIKASEIKPEPIAWLWKYWLARGKLHIIAGAPGSGKTTIYLSFAAIISSGATWPDGTRAKVGNALIWTSEDGHADTIIPRLTRMGADLDRIFIVRSQKEANGKTRAFNPSTDMESLRAKAATISGGVDFVFLDPVVSAVPVTRNSDKNAETRAGLTPFVEFIETLNAAGGGVTHVSKGTAGKDPLERVTGTLAYGAVPRIVLLTSINKAEGDGEPERVMVRVKNNIGPCDGGFGFHIDTAPFPDIEATRIVWELPLEGTAIELMNAAEGETVKVSKLDEAKRFLRIALAKGERPQKEIEAEALAQGISERTLKRASQEIGKRKGGFGSSGGWVWWLS